MTKLEAFVRDHTIVAAAPLVPEIRLHIADNPLAIWQSTAEAMTDPLAQQPFWAFAWPGGQAKARYLLDNPHWVAGRRVLDIGCGSGLGAIAAAMAGAAFVHANDIDPLAMASVRVNARANGVELTTSDDDLLGQWPDDIDVLLLADVVYQPELMTRVARLIETARGKRIPVLFGDRGTGRLPAAPLAKLAEYSATVFPELEAGLQERGLVWQLA